MAAYLPAAALALLLGAGTAQAQTPGVLVSNIDQNQVGFGNLASQDFVHGITTGPIAGGYVLSNVEVRLSGNPSGVTMKIVTGLPSSTNVVAVLTPPSSLVDGINVFTAPEGTVLSAGATYYVVVEANSGGADRTLSSAKDPGGADGWSIADT